MELLTSGITPDGLLNVTSSLVLGLISTSVAICIAFFQSRANKRERTDAAAAWQTQVEELTGRMQKQTDAERDRLVAQVSEKDREIRRLNGLLTRHGDHSD